MKTFKGVIAVLLVLTVLVSLTACHKKDEVAITVGGENISSALYSYYLVAADGEAKQLIDDSEDYDSSAKGFSYYKTTIEGVKFEEYVKNLAVKKCREFAAYEKLMKEAGTKLSDADKTTMESMVEFYWETYGFKDIYAENGVGYETYYKASEHESKRSEYFLNIYREGGEKALTETERQTAVDGHYAAMYALEYDWSSETDVTEEKAKEKMQAYFDRLKNGESFKKLYNEYNEIKEESSTSSEENKSDEPAPKDTLISIIGDEDSGYKFDYFSDVKAMKTDEVKLISDATNKRVYVVVKKDINSDTYYRDTQLVDDIISLLKEDEFKKSMEEYTETLDVHINKYAVNQFKVKKIYTGE